MQRHVTAILRLHRSVVGAVDLLLVPVRGSPRFQLVYYHVLLIVAAPQFRLGVEVSLVHEQVIATGILPSFIAATFSLLRCALRPPRERGGLLAIGSAVVGRGVLRHRRLHRKATAMTWPLVLGCPRRDCVVMLLISLVSTEGSPLRDAIGLACAGRDGLGLRVERLDPGLRCLLSTCCAGPAPFLPLLCLRLRILARVKDVPVVVSQRRGGPLLLR